MPKTTLRKPRIPKARAIGVRELRKIMNGFDMEQQDIAAYVGVHNSTVCKWMGGRPVTKTARIVLTPLLVRVEKAAKKN